MNDPLASGSALDQPSAGFKFIEGKNPELKWVAIDQNHQLAAVRYVRSKALIVGDQELIGENLKTLSLALAADGVQVKAWSFYSGNIPGAEMIYQAEQELEDIINVMEIPDLETMLEARRDELVSMGFISDVSLDSGYAVDNLALMEASKLQAYLIDDWYLLVREFNSRTSEGYTLKDLAKSIKLMRRYGIRLYIGNFPEHYISDYFSIPVELVKYEGMKPWPYAFQEQPDR